MCGSFDAACSTRGSDDETSRVKSYVRSEGGRDGRLASHAKQPTLDVLGSAFVTRFLASSVPAPDVSSSFYSVRHGARGSDSYIFDHSR